nr:MAG TPA: hypothetical protein [Caudoviricetes sp.]DAG55352.1 MAG TPA: hypothetical protein [Caudoviricetes sp.]
MQTNLKLNRNFVSKILFEIETKFIFAHGF